MSLFIRSYKYRMYPTVKQQKFLNRNFGAARFIRNSLVANFNNYGTEDYIENLSEVQLKQNNPWLKDCISYALQQKRMDFSEFKKQHFNRKRKKKVGRPKFKKKGVANDSFRLPGQCLGFMKAFDFEQATVKLTKMDPIKVVYDRTFSGQVKSVTISRDKLNHYYISVCVEEEVEPLPKTYKDIGIDQGLKELLILSDGTRFENPKIFRETQVELKRAQQHLSRKTKGSNRYLKQKLKVAKIHKKITRQRDWYYHNITSWLVKQFDTIILEDLNVSGMIKNRNLSKSIADAAWSKITTMLSYKARWYGKEVLQIGRFFPSSKLCSSCGTKVNDMNLSIREWICSSCGASHDRDINAAKNIYQEGMLKKHGLLSEELPDYSRGETIRPLDFLKGSLEASFNEAISKPIDFTEIYRTA